MCVKHVFHPTGPCCGEHALCLRFPTIDWNRTSWLVRMPDAVQIQKETVHVRRNGSLNSNTWSYDEGQIEGWTAHPSEAEVGTDYEIFGPDTLFGAAGYFYRGDEYIAQHAGSCLWRVHNREELILNNVALIGLTKAMSHGDFSWLMAANFLLTAEQLAYWYEFDVRTPDIVSTVNGHPYYGGGGEINPNGTYVGLRDILSRLVCYWLPLFESRDDLSDPDDMALTNGPGWLVMQIVNTLRAHDPATWPNSAYLYKPSALDLAGSAALSPGFLFGVANDTRSPLYGQLTCFEGGLFEDGGQGEDGAADPVLQSVPWELTSGAEVLAEFGHINRFERTNDNDTLPAWIELELIRI